MPTDEQMLAAVKKHGSQAEAARQLGMKRTTLRYHLRRIEGKQRYSIPSKKREPPKLTIEALHQALQPPNGCRVAVFRERLDEESLAVFDEAIGYEQRDFPASKLRELLIHTGYPEDTIPGVDAINAHRMGRRPCRCKG
jgi:hypothetical protein